MHSNQDQGDVNTDCDTLWSHRREKRTTKQRHNLLSKETVRVSGAERFQSTLCKKQPDFSQQSLLRSRKQRLVMRQNNETMLARHPPHSCLRLKRLNSLNCLIKSVKTLQTAIKLTIVFLLCCHKLSNLVCLDLSLTPNIIISNCSFTARRQDLNL